MSCVVLVLWCTPLYSGGNIFKQSTVNMCGRTFHCGDGVYMFVFEQKYAFMTSCACYFSSQCLAGTIAGYRSWSQNAIKQIKLLLDSCE